MGYIRYGMCPFAVASIGGGMSIDGVGSEKYTWTHYLCLAENCKIWTYKINQQGEVYAEGCSMQFAGLTQDEIIRNSKIKSGLLQQKCVDCEFYFVSGFGNAYCKQTDNNTSSELWCKEFKKKVNG